MAYHDRRTNGDGHNPLTRRHIINPIIPAPPETGTQAARPRGVLVVDDNADIRRVLRIGLHHYGFAVWLAGDGPEAVEVYRSHRPAIDLVLLDVRMPGWDGPTTLATLRDLDPHVRVCFMSGDAGRYSEQDLLGLGARTVFQKPFRLDELADRLDQLMSPPVSLYEDLQDGHWGDNDPGNLVTR